LLEVMSQTVLPSLRHPLLAAMDAVGSGLTAAVDADCWPLSDAEVGRFSTRSTWRRRAWPQSS